VSANIPGPIADQFFKLVDSILFPGEEYARRLFKALIDRKEKVQAARLIRSIASSISAV
jgi:hypothetical protein